MKFPVFYPVTRELRAETSSLETPSSIGESTNFQSLSVMKPSLRCSGAMPCSDKLRSNSAALRHLILRVPRR